MVQRLSFRRILTWTVLVGTASSRGAPPNDPDFARQWALSNVGQTVAGQLGTPGADLSAIQAWSLRQGTVSVVVAVVGTGVDPHAEFADRLLEGYVTSSAGGDPFSTLDVSDHGTRVAGIIAAARDNGTGIAGLDDRARILPIRVMNGPIANESSAAEGIEWAVDAGAGVIVVPLQFDDGTPRLADAVAYAAAHDVLVVAQTGRSGENFVAYPAAFDGCLAVASTDNRDAAASFSNYGSEVDLAAPAVGIWSTSAGGGYGFESQESPAWAAAYVAGVASLIRARAPQLSAVEVGLILKDTAADLGDPGWDVHFGAGRVNAARAMASAPLPALRFEFADPRPTLIDPEFPTAFHVHIAAGAQQVVPQSARLIYSLSSSGTVRSSVLEWTGGDLYRGVLPEIPCDEAVDYYLRAVGNGGAGVTDPADAPGERHRAVALRYAHLLDDDFETDRRWTTEVEGLSTTGAWTRVIPVGTSAQPRYDFSTDAKRYCFVTGQHFTPPDGSNDVDGGPVRLVSPLLGVEGDDVEVSYARWFYSAGGATDTLTVEMSRDGGLDWVAVETVGPGTGWSVHSFRAGEFPEAVGDSFQLRFSTSDLDYDSLTEAAIDEVHIRAILCSSVRGDFDGDGDLDRADYNQGIECWTGPRAWPPPNVCSAFDFDGDDDMDMKDFRELQNRFLFP